MKVRRLELRAFGPFTDAALDLSAGREGLHVIYGPNEAGKSSTLRAIEQVLFGIPTQSGDAFAHSYQNLRIGATLASAAGATLSFVRRKGNANTLLADDGLTPLDDAVLRPFLGNLDRDLFRTMFGIDHPRLVQGGEEIVRGSGNVGQVLFAAGAGIADLQTIQQRLQDEAESLFARRAQTRPINQHLKALDNARKTLRQSQLPSEQWAEHDQRLANARSTRSQVEEELRQLQRDVSRLDRLRQALPLIAERRQVREDLEALGPVKLLRAGFADERRRTMTQLEIETSSQQSAAEGIQRIEPQLKALSLPDALLARAAEIRALADPLGSHRKAQRDLPGLRARREQLEADAAMILRDTRPDMSLDMADRLRLTASQQVAIRDLASRYESLAQGLQQAQEDIEDAQRQLEEERRQLGQLDPPRDSSVLRAAIQRTQRQGDLESLLAKSRGEMRRLQQQAASELKRLPRWSGSREALEGLAVPAVETIDHFERKLAEVEDRVRLLQTKRGEAESARTDVDRQIEQSRLEGEVPSEEDLFEARCVRDLGWQLVLQAWQQGGPDATRLAEFLGHFPAFADLAAAYAQAVREADERADRLRREAGRVAARASLRAGRETLERQVAALDSQWAAARQSQAEIQHAWAECWQPLGIEAGQPREMRAWLAQYQKLVQQGEVVRRQCIDVEQLEADVQTHRSALGERLVEIGETPGADGESLSAMIARCQAVVDRSESAATARAQTEKTVGLWQNRLSAARTRVQRVEGELQQWRGRWATAVEPLGLTPDSTPAEANQIVAQLAELFDRLKQAQSIAERIEGIGQDAENFRDQVRTLAGPIDPELSSLPVEQTADTLLQRLQKAQQDQKLVQSLQQQYEGFTARAEKSRETIAALAATLNTLCHEAGCTTPEMLPEVERTAAAAARLDERFAALNEQMLRLSAGVSVEAFIAEAEKIDADDLPRQLEQKRARIAVLETQNKELSETIGAEENAIRAMQSGSQAAEAAEEIQEHLARLETGAQQYVRLRLASAVLREGIERYRRKNEGPVLRRASEIFRRLTLERFDRLTADCDERGQKLLKGVRTGDGASAVDVSGMSEGTSDQLYLALRLATLESYLAGREPVPFIVDDVLISFDNQRATATLAVLAEFSALTQIIFFTHHAHLVELARQSVDPSVLFIHEMPGR